MGHVALIELLHEHDADVDARDAKGSTPLHAAAFLGRAEAVRDHRALHLGEAVATQASQIDHGFPPPRL